MKRSKFFLSMGAVLLATGGFLATKASKKFVSYSGGVVIGTHNFDNASLPGGSAAGDFTVTKVTNAKTVFLKTANNTIISTLVTTAANTRLYYVF